MAKNVIFGKGTQLSLVPTQPSQPASGDPVLVGQLPGVALTAAASAGAAVTVQTVGVVTISVKGIDGGGNSAVAVGDLLYYTSADTPPVSKKATGVRFGYALATITSGSTATIQVKLGY